MSNKGMSTVIEICWDALWILALSLSLYYCNRPTEQDSECPCDCQEQ